MGESADNEATDKVKVKKHKKHKKSKKASITLDEFLNMNKDVFGDGLNVHGIEEVPTQVVLKKVKGKKILNKNEPKIVNADLAKLKKQGIVVKTKSGINPGLSNLKQDITKPKVLSTPNEILSKLMNQGNSQIKIVKKSVPQNDTVVEDEHKIDNYTEADNTNKNIEISPNKEEENKSIMENNFIAENKMDVYDKITDKKQEKEDSTINDSNILGNSNNKISESEDCNKMLVNEEKNYSKIDNAHVAENEHEAMEDVNSSVSNTVISSPKQVILSKTAEDTEDERIKNKGAADTNDDEDNDSENVANKTLDALKHLSHLITVKSVSQGNTTSDHTPKDLNEDDVFDTKKNDINITKQKMEQIIPKQVISTPLSKLSEHLTVKPSKQSPSVKLTNSDVESEGEFHDGNDIHSNTDEETYVSKPLNKNLTEVRKLSIKNFPTSPNKFSMKNEITNEADDDDEEIEDCSRKSSNLDILKRLTNVTAKPINNVNIKQMVNIKPVNKPLLKDLPKNPCKAGIDEDVEIFNIDDSDSDGNESINSNNKFDEKAPNSPMAVLQNLGKNLTVKSNKANTILSNITHTKENLNVKQNRQSQDIQKSINLQNKLKYLSGTVTVKPSSGSPNMFSKELHKSFDDCDDDEANDSGSESNVSKVKITEMHDDDVSDDEYIENQSNAIIESPHGTSSETEDHHEEPEDDFSDCESQVKSNNIKKENESPMPNKSLNFKNFSKELTIKSLNPKKQDSDEETKLPNSKEMLDDLPNINKQIAVKQVKPNLLHNDQSVNKPNQQQGSGSVNQTSVNKKVNTSSNQVNTVKTVKRFQSQTVIEEITTTVTKTIRTVNQSTNEVIQNRCPTRTMIRPQKINNQLARPLQGTAVRFATPTIGTKIKNAPVRNPNPSMVRPSNQLVPVRPTLSLPRPGPSTSGARKPAPPRVPLQKPPIGKLKISPNALNHAPKRPSNETAGHFSCVKKSKESLVQTSDATDFDDDAATQFSMTQSRSDFSSISKTIKGKGTVTATQMRSEVNTCSQQQLSRLSNVSGLKIMKTNAKQSSQVEEKCEINATNKNTLEAIEKLQRHGLLIKKPRLDEYNDQPDSESDDETSEK